MTAILTLDIGGSKTAISLWQATCACPRLLHTAAVPTDYTDADGLITHLRQFCQTAANNGHNADEIEACALAIAGPTNRADGLLRLTNNPLVLDITELYPHFPACRFTVLNDLEALAYALPHLAASSLQQLNPNAAHDPNAARFTRLAAAVGTGFGAAALLNGGRVLPTEAGHCRFTPADAAQAKLPAALHLNTITNETLLSGDGLERIYTALNPQAAPLTAAEINSNAQLGCPAALAATDMFSSCLGTALGNLAVTFLAGGGIFLAGGVCQKLGPLLNARLLMQALVIPGPFAAYLAALPVCRITDANAVSLGAAAFADRTLLG